MGIHVSLARTLDFIVGSHYNLWEGRVEGPDGKSRQDLTPVMEQGWRRRYGGNVLMA